MTTPTRELAHGRVSILAGLLAERLEGHAKSLKAEGAAFQEVDALAALAAQLDSLGKRAWENDAEAVKQLCSLLGRADLLKAYDQERIRAKLAARKADQDSR